MYYIDYSLNTNYMIRNLLKAANALTFSTMFLLLLAGCNKNTIIFEDGTTPNGSSGNEDPGNSTLVTFNASVEGRNLFTDILRRVASEIFIPLTVGGGIRTEERIETYLSLGVGRCILGSVAVTDFDFTARMLKKYGDKIAVGVDAKDGYVAIHGWKEVSAEPGVDFCKRLADAGCTAIIYTDIACDGAMQGTNLGLYRTLAKEVPGVAFTASGGISSEAELLELKKMGTAAAILGKSLYTGALDLARCVQLVQD